MLQAHRWLTVVPLLLLAALLAGRQLNTWAFSADESREMISAGARDFGPRSLAQAVAEHNATASDQAFGWVMVLNLWGGPAGWSPVAARGVAWLAGLLCLALVYRVGRSLFTPEVGAIAALLLATSTHFVSWMHVARFLTLVTLFATLATWGYWRLALDARRPARRHWAALALGGAGLLYTHYLAALLLVVIGLYHLAFARRGRRWWGIALLLALVAAGAAPQLAVLLRATDFYMGRDGPVVSAPAMAVRIVYALGNGLVSLPQVTGPLLLLAMAAVLLRLLLRQARGGHEAARFLGIMVLGHVFLVLAVNEVVGALWYLDRVRYFLALWPAIALLAGHGLRQLGRRRPRAAELLLVAVVASGAALILRSTIYQTYAAYNLTYIHLADQALQREARPDDLLLIEDAVDLNLFYQGALFRPRVVWSRDGDAEAAAREAAGRGRVWLLAAAAGGPVEEKLSADMRVCRRPVRRKGMALTLYARSVADCG